MIKNKHTHSKIIFKYCVSLHIQLRTKMKKILIIILGILFIGCGILEPDREPGHPMDDPCADTICMDEWGNFLDTTPYMGDDGYCLCNQ